MVHSITVLIFQQGRPTRILHSSELTPIIVRFYEEPSRSCHTTTPADNTLAVEMDLIVRSGKTRPGDRKSVWPYETNRLAHKGGLFCHCLYVYLQASFSFGVAV